MTPQKLRLAGLLQIDPVVRRDERGFFLESYSEGRYQSAGVACKFVQDNHSLSTRGTLRGMHFQSQPGQDKLVRVVRGVIYDVAVDIRPGSDTFGQWQGVTLDDQNHRQLFVPRGFAHGFCVLSEVAEVLYKVSSPYDGATEMGFAFDDPDVGITWPVDKPLISARDQQAPRLKDISRTHLRAGSSS